MEKKGVSEIVATVLLIMLVVLAVAGLAFFATRFLGDEEEKMRLRNEMQQVSTHIDDISFDTTTDPTQMIITLSKGSGLQDFLGTEPKTITYDVVIYNSRRIEYPDVVSVVDWSGSSSENAGRHLKIWQLFRNANLDFIDALSGLDSRLGLVCYRDDAEDSTLNHPISNDWESLRNKVNNWTHPNEGACMCCGLNKALEFFGAIDSEGHFKSIVLVSDGGTTGDCGLGDAEYAAQVAVDAAAAQDIVVYVLGYGKGPSFENKIPFLQDLANRGNGTYTTASTDDLAEIYRKIAHGIEYLKYEEETRTETVFVAKYRAVEAYAYLRVIVYTDDNTFMSTLKIEDLPAPIETKDVGIDIDPDWGIIPDMINKVEIYAVAETQDGEEILSTNPVAVWEKPGEY